MEPVTVLLAESDALQRERITAWLEHQPDITVAGTAADGAEAIVRLDELRPRVLITDLLLPQADGYQVMTHAGHMPVSDRPKIIVVTSLSRPDFVARAVSLGAAYFMARPVELPLLTQRIRELGHVPDPQLLPAPAARPVSDASAAEDSTDDTVSKYVSRMLMTLGVAPHLNGHRFVHRAILLAVSNPQLLDSMTTLLYPTVATEYATTVSRVERSIRFAIARTWDTGGSAAMNRMLGRQNAALLHRPSNREYIALVAERVRLRSNA